jgi:dihydrolipoamide dehydrogenase
MLVIGGGIIGLEMASVYSTLGARIDVVEMLDGLMTGADRDLVKVWEKKNAGRFDNVMLKTKTVGAEATPEGIRVSFEGEKAPAGPQVYDLVLVAVGRSPNGRKIDADKAGVVVSDRGFISVDKQMRTNQSHIFAIGDIIGQPMLAHKAVHEGVICVEAIKGLHPHPMDKRMIPGCTYCSPQVASVGLTEQAAKDMKLDIRVGRFPFIGNGKAIALGEDQGLIKVIFDKKTGQLLGAHMIGAEVTELIQGYVVAMNLETTEAELMHTVFPHPTLSEMMKEAVLDAYGRVLNM